MEDVKTFKSFTEIVGQEKAITFLKRVMAREKIPHAYLFTGIPGVGKTTTALALTQAINCHEQIDGEGCGQCKSCRQVMHGNFPDLITIRPDGQNIKIEQIRDLNRALAFKPVSGGYRVSIILEAEMMTDEAANSFLKTLEEPPPDNILILNVTEPLDLIPTIVSRCQKISFKPLPVHVIAEWLMEKESLDDEKALVLAKISEGSLGRTVQMIESGFFEKRQESLLRLLQLPELSSEQALEMALEITRKGKKKNLNASETKDISLFQLLSVWKTWYRDLILMKVKGPADLLINIDFSHKLKNICKNFKIEDLMNSLMIVDRAQRDLMQTRNIDLIMENAVLSLRGFASPSK